MIIAEKTALAKAGREVSGPGWTSLRLLVKSDGMGFSMTETKVLPGTVLDLQYKHHIEACYCIGGAGTVTETGNGKVHEIRPGVLYAPNDHEPHQVRVEGSESLHLVCVFSPALQGDEVHGPDGSYPAS